MESQIQEEFALRYYRWALADAEREIVEDYPFLGNIRSASILPVVDYLRKHSPDEQRQFLQACIKLYQQSITKRVRSTITEKEVLLAMKIRDEISEMALQYRENFSLNVALSGKNKAKRIGDLVGIREKVYGISEQEKVAWVSKYQTYGIKKARKSVLKSLVRKHLIPICGNISMNESIIWILSTTIGEWQIETEIDFGGFSSMAYSHYLRSTNPATGEILQLVPTVSITEWLGFFSVTEWDILHEGEEEAAVHLFAQIAAHFFNAAPTLLRGLI
jgi:hypothetical protein